VPDGRGESGKERVVGAASLPLALFTGVRGIGILGTSHKAHSPKFAFREFCEVRL
jgi:hypothetical protein